MPEANGHKNGTAPELTVVHTSDLHLGGRFHADGHVSTLRAVMRAVDETSAQVLILAGDTFDSHRVPADVLADATAMLSETRAEVVILPGNHDPATPDAVFHQIERLPNLHIMGVTSPASLHFDELDLHLWGAPHTAYADMSPLAGVPARERRWQIVVAHGHWLRGPHDAHRGWLMHDHEIDAVGADYLAFGHWDVPQPAGTGAALAYYSGSPEIAKTVNVVRLGAAGVNVERHPLQF
jgi:DNA repair exonuclease SbcCD nuclease subunit